MAKRINISSGVSWESEVGYSRAVRVGNFIEVAGTTAVDDSTVMFPHDPYNQAQYILLKIEQALIDAGASMADVVRTRIYLTDMEYFNGVAKAHREVFANIRPVSSMIEVYSLIKEGLVVEIEATAILTD